MTTSVLYFKNDSGVTDLRKFIEYTKNRKDPITFGSAGVGSMSHIACLLLFDDLKVEALHVPYKGVAPAMNDLLAGQIDAMCDFPTIGAPMVRAGRIKALAALSSERQPQLPAVPTVAETGAARTTFVAWSALYVPAKTSDEIVAKLQRSVQEALRDSGMQAQSIDLGVRLPSSEEATPAAVNERTAKDVQILVPLLKAKTTPE